MSAVAYPGTGPRYAVVTRCRCCGLVFTRAENLDLVAACENVKAAKFFDLAESRAHHLETRGCDLQVDAVVKVDGEVVGLA